MSEKPIPFSGSPLDRAGNLRRNADWLHQQKQAATARYLLLRELKPMVSLDGGARLAWFPTRFVEPLADCPTMLLGLSDGAAHFVVDVDQVPGIDDLADEQNKFIDVRSIAPQLPPEQAAILAQARSLVDWHQRHGFCARCGAPTEMAEAGYSRSCTSSACNAQHFPRTDPVVIMLAVHEDRILLGRQRQFPPGMYSALAGFMEPGETIEEAVRRELHEEAGVTTGGVRYLASQPWPFPSSLMIGCVAQTVDPTLAVDTHELEDARWFHRDEVATMLKNCLDMQAPLRMPPPLSLAHQITRRFLAE